jgi:hypothetical protein
MTIGRFLISALFVLVGCLFASLDTRGQTRIRFARGRTSASLSGTLAPKGVKRYVLGARIGQQLSGNVSSKNNCIKFTDSSTGIGFTTEKGDNRISITNYCRSATSFVMTISIN